ncbi:MAG TPA: AIR synthase-related protein [Candidatus Paceibacterota bacterium]|jgi:phosphoribosylformylglycinamidine cyclo-ligase|nr:AIR synthase-related protein [Candidatus Paceibacterota bacterium]
MSRRPNAYARAGVDVDVEAKASRIMYEASKKTFRNRQGKIGEIVMPFRDFAALKMVSVEGLPRGSYLSMGFDTAGTKVEIAQRVGKHDTIAFDLFAMVCDDALVRGGEPILVGSNLDLASLGTDVRFLPIVRELARGYVAAAKEAGVAVINGEIAQMGKLVGGHGDFPYHWGAACIWVARKDRIFTGEEIKRGDTVVVLREKGFRTNGLTLARSVFERTYGKAWHARRFRNSTIGLHTLAPATIYSKFVTRLHGVFFGKASCEIHGIAHITGGGIPEKMLRVLRPSRLGAQLPDLFEPPAIVTHCQKLGRISDHDAYRAWNMGQGLAVITPEPEKILRAAKQYGIEACIAGEIVKGGGVTLVSRGVQKPGKALEFE